MIKFTRGGIGSADGTMHDIIVKAKAPNTLKDAMIGGGMTLVGIAYLTYTAFKSGALAFEKAELKAMYDAGVISENPDEIL